MDPEGTPEFLIAGLLQRFTEHMALSNRGVDEASEVFSAEIIAKNEAEAYMIENKNTKAALKKLEEKNKEANKKIQKLEQEVDAEYAAEQKAEQRQFQHRYGNWSYPLRLAGVEERSNYCNSAVLLAHRSRLGSARNRSVF